MKNIEEITNIINNYKELTAKYETLNQELKLNISKLEELLECNKEEKSAIKIKPVDLNHLELVKDDIEDLVEENKENLDTEFSPVRSASELIQELDDIKLDVPRNLTSSNIQVSSLFKNHLLADDIQYNISEEKINIIAYPESILTSLASKCVYNSSFKDYVEELKAKINEFSKEELSELKEYYKDSETMKPIVQSFIIKKLKSLEEA